MTEKTVERTSAGLRDALFKALDDLRVGNIEAGDAKAIAGLAREICNTVRLEMDAQKMRAMYPSDSKLPIPRPLDLGATEQKAIASK
jgi:hypothetical protein